MRKNIEPAVLLSGKEAANKHICFSFYIVKRTLRTCSAVCNLQRLIAAMVVLLLFGRVAWGQNGFCGGVDPVNFNQSGIGVPINHTLQNFYPYKDHTPIITLNVRLIVVQDENGENNFQEDNEEHLAYLNALVPHLNNVYSNFVAPPDAACGEFITGDSKIRFHLTGINFVQDTIGNTLSWKDENGHKNNLDYHMESGYSINKETEINVFFVEKPCTSIPNLCGSHQGIAPRDSKQNIFMVMEGQFKRINEDNEDPTALAQGWTFPHEFGHVLGINDLIAGQGEPLHDFCNNFMISQAAGAHNFITTEQLAKWHRALRFPKSNVGINVSNLYKYAQSCIYEDKDFIVSEDAIWNYPVILYENLVIKTGATLNISNSLYMPENARVIVERGAKLIIDGGIITKNPQCKKPWEGVEVWGYACDDDFCNPLIAQNPAYITDLLSGNPNAGNFPNEAAGIVLMKNGATIANAFTGISTQRRGGNYPDHFGGIIYAQDSHFYGNQKAVELLRYDYPNISKFINCDFRSYTPYFNLDDNLATISWSYLVNNDNDNFSWYRGITMWAVKGIEIIDCTFDFLCPTNNTNKGAIVSYAASYTMRGGAVMYAQTGVLAEADNHLGLETKIFDKVRFVNNHTGIYNIAANDWKIQNCTFERVPEITADTDLPFPFAIIYYLGFPDLKDDMQYYYTNDPVGICMHGYSSFRLENNTLSNLEEGCTINHSDALLFNQQKDVEHNIFNDCKGALSFLGNNDYAQTHCNVFNSSDFDLSYLYSSIQQSAGKIPNQGISDENDPQNSQAAANKFSESCTNPSTHIYTMPYPLTEKFDYVTYSEVEGVNLRYVPTCDEGANYALKNIEGQTHNPDCFPEDADLINGGGGDGGGLPPPCAGLSRDCLEEHLHQIQEIKELIDGGSTAHYIQQIEHEAAHPDTHTALLHTSSYLSPAVLLAYIRHPEVSQENKSELLFANAPLSEVVWQEAEKYLDEHDYKTLYELQYSGVFSPWQTLQQALQQLSQGKARIFAALMQAAIEKKDVNGCLDLIKADEQNPDAGIYRIMVLLHFGEYQKARDEMEQLPEDNAQQRAEKSGGIAGRMGSLPKTR
ncbi:MAG: hypothetical protein IPL35_01835 [Sphingobacteriales bacterium]|nr:hypothetical protein [Sphingobacteriales bacterium]